MRARKSSSEVRCAVCKPRWIPSPSGFALRTTLGMAGYHRERGESAAVTLGPAGKKGGAPGPRHPRGYGVEAILREASQLWARTEASM